MPVEDRWEKYRVKEQAPEEAISPPDRWEKYRVKEQAPEEAISPPDRWEKYRVKEPVRPALEQFRREHPAGAEQLWRAPRMPRGLGWLGTAAEAISIPFQSAPARGQLRETETSNIVEAPGGKVFDIPKTATGDYRKFAATPAIPEGALQEAHPEGPLRIGGYRRLETQGPEALEGWLQDKGFEVEQIGNRDWAIRKPGEPEWRRFDPSGLGKKLGTAEWTELGQDVVEALPDAFKLAMMGATGFAGSVAGAAGGPIISTGTGAAAAGLGTAGAEAQLQKTLDPLLGIKLSPEERLRAMGREGAMGVMGEVGGRAALAGLGAAARGVRRAYGTQRPVAPPYAGTALPEPARPAPVPAGPSAFTPTQRPEPPAAPTAPAAAISRREFLREEGPGRMRGSEVHRFPEPEEGGLRPTTPLRAEGPYPGARAPPGSVRTYRPSEEPPPRGEAVYVDPLDMELDVKGLQFRKNVDPKTGVEKELGPWNEEEAGAILLWRDKTNKLFVANGYHRRHAAVRDGAPRALATIIDEVRDNVSKEQVRAIAALQNIRADHGTIEDFARFFRNSNLTQEKARDLGVLRTAKSVHGWTVGKDSAPSTYAAWLDGKITDGQAVAIARAAPGNEAVQAAGLKRAMTGGLRDQELEAFVGTLRGTAPKREGGLVQGEIFTFDDAAIREAEAIAKVVARDVRDLRRQLRVRGAGENPELATRVGIDVTDPAATQAKLVELKDVLSGLKTGRVFTNREAMASLRQRAGLPTLEEARAAVPPKPPEPAATQPPAETAQPAARRPLVELEATPQPPKPPELPPALEAPKRPSISQRIPVEGEEVFSRGPPGEALPREAVPEPRPPPTVQGQLNLPPYGETYFTESHRQAVRQAERVRAEWARSPPTGEKVIVEEWSPHAVRREIWGTPKGQEFRLRMQGPEASSFRDVRALQGREIPDVPEVRLPTPEGMASARLRKARHNEIYVLEDISKPGAPRRRWSTVQLDRVLEFERPDGTIIRFRGPTPMSSAKGIPARPPAGPQPATPEAKVAKWPPGGQGPPMRLSRELPPYVKQAERRATGQPEPAVRKSGLIGMARERFRVQRQKTQAKRPLGKAVKPLADVIAGAGHVAQAPIKVPGYMEAVIFERALKQLFPKSPWVARYLTWRGAHALTSRALGLGTAASVGLPTAIAVGTSYAGGAGLRGVARVMMRVADSRLANKGVKHLAEKVTRGIANGKLDVPARQAFYLLLNSKEFQDWISQDQRSQKKAGSEKISDLPSISA